MKDFNTTTRQKIEQFYDQHKLMYKKRADYIRKEMKHQTLESMKGMNVTGDVDKLLDPEDLEDTVKMMVYYGL